MRIFLIHIRGTPLWQEYPGSKQGPTKNEVLSRAVEHPLLKDAAAHLTQVSDDVFERVVEESRAERLRLRQDTAAG